MPLWALTFTVSTILYIGPRRHSMKCWDAVTISFSWLWPPSHYEWHPAHRHIHWDGIAPSTLMQCTCTAWWMSSGWISCGDLLQSRTIRECSSLCLECLTQVGTASPIDHFVSGADRKGKIPHVKDTRCPELPPLTVLYVKEWHEMGRDEMMPNEDMNERLPINTVVTTYFQLMQCWLSVKHFPFHSLQ